MLPVFRGYLLFTTQNRRLFLVQGGAGDCLTAETELPQQALILASHEQGCQFILDNVLYNVGLATILFGLVDTPMIEIKDLSCMSEKARHGTPVIFFWQQMSDFKQGKPHAIQIQPMKRSFTQFLSARKDPGVVFQRSARAELK